MEMTKKRSAGLEERRFIQEGKSRTFGYSISISAPIHHDNQIERQPDKHSVSKMEPAAGNKDFKFPADCQK